MPYSYWKDTKMTTSQREQAHTKIKILSKQRSQNYQEIKKGMKTIVSLKKWKGMPLDKVRKNHEMDRKMNRAIKMIQDDNDKLLADMEKLRAGKDVQVKAGNSKFKGMMELWSHEHHTGKPHGIMHELKSDIREMHSKLLSMEESMNGLKKQGDESEEPEQKAGFIREFDRLKTGYGITERRYKQAIREYKKLHKQGLEDQQRSQWLLENTAKISLIESVTERQKALVIGEGKMPAKYRIEDMLLMNPHSRVSGIKRQLKQEGYSDYQIEKAVRENPIIGGEGKLFPKKKAREDDDTQRNYTLPEFDKIETALIKVAKKKGDDKKRIERYDSNSIERFAKKFTRKDDLIYDFVMKWGGGSLALEGRYNDWRDSQTLTKSQRADKSKQTGKDDSTWLKQQQQSSKNQKSDVHGKYYKKPGGSTGNLKDKTGKLITPQQQQTGTGDRSDAAKKAWQTRKKGLGTGSGQTQVSPQLQTVGDALEALDNLIDVKGLREKALTPKQRSARTKKAWLSRNRNKKDKGKKDGKKHLNILGKHHPYDEDKTGYTGKSGVMGDKQELPSYDWLVGKKAVDPTQVSGRTWGAKEKSIKKAIGKNLLARGLDKKYTEPSSYSDEVLDEYLPLVSGVTRKELSKATDIANLLFMASDVGDAEDYLNQKTDTEYGGLNRLGRENLIAFYGGEDFSDDAFKEDNGITIEQALYGNQKKVDWDHIMGEISDGAYFSSGQALDNMMDGEGWNEEFEAGANDGQYDY